MRTDGQREELLKWRRKMHDMHLLTHSPWLGFGEGACTLLLFSPSLLDALLSQSAVGFLLCVMMLIYIVYKFVTLAIFCCLYYM